MESPSPRLLVTLHPRSDTSAAIDRHLPQIPWAYLDSEGVRDLSHVDAMLVGSLSNELGTFDPKTTPALRFVQRVFTGLDGFPFERFPPSVQIAGNVGAFGPFVAEHAMALALAAGRDLARAKVQVKEGRLRPVPEPRVLYDSTALVLGFGAIGQEIARRLTAFGARVIGVNRDGSPSPQCEKMFSSHDLKEALGQADFIFDVRPLTKLTVGSIGKAELEAMRPQAVFVNVGRAGTVNEEALYQHLRDHPEFRAALDVWWGEDYGRGTITKRFPFDVLPNFTGTPHMAGGGVGAKGAESRTLTFALANLERFYEDGRPLHVADRREYEG